MPRLRRPRSPVLALRRAAAALLACCALLLALRPPAREAAAGPPPTAPVVVATGDLSPGAPLRAADLAVARWPRSALPDGTAAAPDRLTGQVLAAPVRRGEPVTDVRVVGPRLWSQVPPGQVAAPVRLADLAVSTLLREGDRVDVLATGSDPGARVVAAGALVLAAAAPGTDGSPGAGDGGLLVLAVDPDTAAGLAAAAATGTLTVTLGRP
ncbi:Flp pilus assembly protein CpaB [Modestobacter sp. NPDC049651]|uniref:Flp pilus assembly protein CpaB n=1 Tax=unclassified Modestobacter TaxID=2643866 RepID=UPI0034015B15